MTDSEDFDYDGMKLKILYEINRVRAEPTSYIHILNEYIRLLDGNIIRRSDGTQIETTEGPNAFFEAISFLKKAKPINTLTYDSRIELAAEDHSKDLGQKSFFSSIGSNGRNPSERIEKYCEWEGICCENLDAGSNNATEVIISWLVDDGVSLRANRQNLFREDINFVGISVAYHKQFNIIVVTDFVGTVRDLGEPHYNLSSYKFSYPQETHALSSKKSDIKNTIKTAYQLQDIDAPYETVDIKLRTEYRLWQGLANKVQRKTYTLNNGTYHVVEIEDI